MRELKILKKVYFDFPDRDIGFSESPDFVITAHKKCFGVEIAEYYQLGETGGRIANEPKYLDNVINRGTVHPRDAHFVEVVHVGMTRDEKTEFATHNMMYTPILSASKRLEKLGELIEKKNKLFKTYRKDLDHIDLLIYDPGDLQAGMDGEAIMSRLRRLQDSSVNELQTNFKNVYVFSEKMGSNEIIHLWRI